MNLVLDETNIDLNNFYYGKKMENNIISDSYFYNIYYSTDLIHINNVLIKIKLNNVYISEYFNKVKCSFNPSENRKVVKFLSHIETKLLEMFDDEYVNDHKLFEQLKIGEIKINNHSNMKIKKHTRSLDILLKISGIWETHDKKGVIMKFII